MMKRSAKYRFNIHIIILSVYLIYVLYLFLSGKITMILHPKMYIPVIIGAVIMLGIIISSISHPGLSPVHKTGSLAFLAVILLGLFNPPKSLESTISKNRGSDFTISAPSSENQTEKKEPEYAVSAETAPAETPVSLSSSEDLLNKSKTDEPEVDFLISDLNFIDTMLRLYNNPEAYIGKTVRVSGFAYHLENLEPNQFIIARLFITCCAADAGIAGFACTLENDTLPPSGEWFEITGILDTFQYSNHSTPQLIVTETHSIDKPDNIYVY